MTARILVAGIGNIFLGDDGFGSEVVRNAELPQDDPNVRVIDYGIGGMHLAYDLLERLGHAGPRRRDTQPRQPGHAARLPGRP